VTVVIGGVLLLEWQQGTRTELAMAPDAELAFQPSAADSTTFESAPDEDAQGGSWDAFTANNVRVQGSGEATKSAATETQGAWQGFVREGSTVGGVAADAVGTDQRLEAGITPESRSGQGRADEASSRPRDVAASPDKEPVGARGVAREDDVSDRAAVLGEPPSTLSAQRAEALKDAATESERSESEAKEAIERQANVAEASGEVVERTPLRSFKVGGDGIWYQAGYNGEATTSLPRGSDALRELMKKHPGFDWNKMLDRSAKQVFQLDGAWYALEARQDDE
jgi:hypothetical protein